MCSTAVMSKQMRHQAGVWRPEAGASEKAIAGLVATAPIALSVAYLEQLRESDGGEGDVAIEPAWGAFWPAANVVTLNREYAVAEFAPGLFDFGSHGGGELM